MFLKLYKNSFSDKMHWSPGFHKADLVGLEMAEKRKKEKEFLVTELEIIKQEIEHNHKNKLLKLIHLL